MDLTLPRRLDKFLSNAQVGSRKTIDRLWREGRVTVNGDASAWLGALIDPVEDVVCVDGARVEQRAPTVYAVLSKPMRTLTTWSDPQGRPTIRALVPDAWPGRVGAVGRLDRDTTGALVLTDDGDLSYLLTHPNHHVWKRYILYIKRPLDPDDPRLEQLRRGIELNDGKPPTRPARAEVVAPHAPMVALDGPPAQGVLALEINEGRNRQVRRMARRLGLGLIHLHREAVGPVHARGLELGAWRALEPGEVDALYAAAGGRELPRLRAVAALRRQLASGRLTPPEVERVERYLADHAEPDDEAVTQP